MAKLQDKFFNRVIEGNLDLEAGDLKPSDVASAIAGGNVDNAKPIYWHGINMYNAQREVFQFHILNNSPELINSVAKINAWLTSIAGAVLISGNGVLSKDGTFHSIINLQRSADNPTLYAVYLDTETGYQSVVMDLNRFTNIDDNINKIN